MSSVLKTLSDIVIYPIKSLAGVHLKTSKLSKNGLLYDRCLMLIDEQNVFISQRSHPVLSLLKTELNEGVFTISKPNDSGSTLTVDLNLLERLFDLSPQKVEIWDDKIFAKGTSLKTIDLWFSDFLGIKCSLVRLPEDSTERQIGKQFQHSNALNSVSFSDGFPILIIGSESLSDLNNRLGKPVAMQQFRPNLVFEGGNAYEEDFWHEFTIGQAAFIGTKPCSRCIMTTIESNKGVFQKEPLRTLATYRKQKNNKIYFGQNILIGSDVGKETAISIGDKIELISLLEDSQMPWGNI
ncbi:MAG: MOSC domain-containing protein [Pseudarcicella sp.]|nr:MOSC domain-containing protein [Pseudarcicella sp.]MBP6411443.1 MOSC domain-containing protein [Pseudarcicella sp.]